MAYREKQLLEAVDAFNAEHDRFVQDSNQSVPGEAYWEAVTELLDLFAEGDIPAKCRVVADAVARFQEAVDAFDDREDVDNGYPGHEFWDARENLARVRREMIQKAKAPRHTETVAQLCALPNMSHAQVAQMWNFRDADGNLMPWLVQRELDQPGSVIDNAADVIGPHWRHPDAPEEDDTDDGAAEAAALEEKRKKNEQDAKPCKETPRELWEQGVEVWQSARLLKRPEEEVRELFAGFDKAKADGTLPAVDEEAGNRPKKSTSDNSELIVKVVALKEDGNTNAAIAKELGISAKKVAALLKEAAQPA